MVPHRQPGRRSVDLLLWAWVARCGWSAALGLSCTGPASLADLGPSLLWPVNPAALGVSPVALGSAALGLWVGQLASAPVCTHRRFQMWAPRPLICVCTTGLQVSAGAAYPVFIVQRLSGEGCQRPWLLWRVL